MNTGEKSKNPLDNPMNRQYHTDKFTLADNGFTHIFDGTLEELIEITDTVDAFEFMKELDAKYGIDD